MTPRIWRWSGPARVNCAFAADSRASREGGFASEAPAARAGRKLPPIAPRTRRLNSARVSGAAISGFVVSAAGKVKGLKALATEWLIDGRERWRAGKGGVPKIP